MEKLLSLLKLAAAAGGDDDLPGDVTEENNPLLAAGNVDRPMAPKDGLSTLAAAVKSGDGPSVSTDELLKILRDELTALFRANPKVSFGQDSPSFEDAKDPSLAPTLWISRWVDSSQDHGFGYMFSDDAAGVLFTDNTRLTLLPNGLNIQYMTRDMVLHDEYTIQWHPVCLVRKVKVVQRGKAYMRKLTKACADEHAKKSDGAALARYPYMVHWHRTEQYVLMQLSNGTIQINYLKDHVKIILCPLKKAVTFLLVRDGETVFDTYSFDGISKNGCSVSVFDRLKHAFAVIEKLVASKSDNKSCSDEPGAGAAEAVDTK